MNYNDINELYAATERISKLEEQNHDLIYENELLKERNRELRRALKTIKRTAKQELSRIERIF